MAEAKHTPGPWQYYYDQSDHFVHKVRVGAGLVCQMPGWAINSKLKAEQEANARLIAAAPELLAALQGLVDAYCRAGASLTREELMEDRKRLIAARAAIAEAKGQS